MTNDKALEAAHAAYERYGQLGDLKSQRLSDGCMQAVISAYLSALPGEVEVAGLAERLNRWRSETVNQWSDEYEPRTSWEKQVSDAMKEWYEASTQVSSALQAMRARAEAAELERDEARLDRITAERDAQNMANQLVAAEQRGLEKAAEAYRDGSGPETWDYFSQAAAAIRSLGDKT